MNSSTNCQADASLPTILAMWEATDGILWIISYKADAKWKEAGPDENHRMFDSVLEARDATTGDLIAAREFDQYLTGFTSSGHAVMQELDDQDQPKHTLVRMSIRRSGEPSP